MIIYMISLIAGIIFMYLGNTSSTGNLAIVLIAEGVFFINYGVINLSRKNSIAHI